MDNRGPRLPSPAVEPKVTWWAGAIIVQCFSSAYGGYFGAGNGILMLAAMGLLGLHGIHRANGIKNFLGTCINSVAIVSFGISHLVAWPRALLMAVGAVAGGYLGTRKARRLDQRLVRRAIGALWLV